MIEYITIATAGNAVDFGDKTAVKAYTTSVSSPTRAIVAGGFSNTPSPAAFNIIEFVEILTTGNSVDFGDIDTGTLQTAAGASNGHGGL